MTLVKQGKFLLKASIVLLLSFILGSFISDTVTAKEGKMKYPVNQSGQTYGSSLYSQLYGGEPDLISAVNQDRVTGYVLKSDLDGPMPKTREEAIAMMKKSQENGGRTIPLYAADGKTILGEYKIDPPMIEEFRVNELDTKMFESGLNIKLPE